LAKLLVLAAGESKFSWTKCFFPDVKLSLMGGRQSCENPHSMISKLDGPVRPRWDLPVFSQFLVRFGFTK
jgi:hypothetical protein